MGADGVRGMLWGGTPSPTCVVGGMWWVVWVTESGCGGGGGTLWRVSGEGARWSYSCMSACTCDWVWLGAGSLSAPHPIRPARAVMVRHGMRLYTGLHMPACPGGQQVVMWCGVGGVCAAQEELEAAKATCKSLEKQVLERGEEGGAEGEVAAYGGQQARTGVRQGRAPTRSGLSWLSWLWSVLHTRPTHALPHTCSLCPPIPAPTPLTVWCGACGQVRDKGAHVGDLEEELEACEEDVRGAEARVQRLGEEKQVRVWQGGYAKAGCVQGDGEGVTARAG